MANATSPATRPFPWRETPFIYVQGLRMGRRIHNELIPAVIGHMQMKLVEAVMLYKRFKGRSYGDQ